MCLDMSNMTQHPLGNILFVQLIPYFYKEKLLYWSRVLHIAK